MKDKSQISFKSIICFFDVFFLIVYFIVFLKIQYEIFTPIDYHPESWTFKELLQMHYKALILLIISWGFIASYVKGYNLTRRDKFVNILKKLIKQGTFFTIIIFALSGLKETDLFSNRVALLFIVTFFSTLLVLRILIFVIYKMLHNNGQNISNVVIIGANKNTFKLIDIIKERKDYGFCIEGLLTNKINFEAKDFTAYLIKDINFSDFVKKNKIQKVFISQMASLPRNFITEVTNFCDMNHLEIVYIPYSGFNDFSRLEIDYIDTLPLLRVKKFPLDIIFNQYVKSFFDKILALLVCVLLLSWLVPIIALLIYIDSGGPVFFIQGRNGLGGNQFGCIKFRTMVPCRTNSIVATERNDSRITRLGSLLRKSSLDELPQFFNVLRGDMSIVGPRPHMITQDVYYAEVIQKYSLRHYVKPGITGLAQIKGYRGAIDSDYDMEKRIRADLYYVKNWSFLLDIQIIYQTALLMLKGDENAI